MKACLISIGDELLIGQTINTNAAWIGEQLNHAGIDVVQALSISDKENEIIRALDEAHEQSDVILVTGGLGPTKDDITKHTLCKYFNTDLVLNQDVLKKLEEFFAKRNRPMLPANIKQAEIPRDCTMIPNQNGTAQGMWFERNGKITVSMPGVPYEMKGMMESFVLPELRKKNDLKIVQRTMLTTGIGESFLAERIVEIENALRAEGLGLAYLPSLGILKLRITAKGSNAEALQKRVDFYFEEIKNSLGDFYFSEGNESLEMHVSNFLRANNLTLSVVESCTGGKIASMFTAIPGASDIFNGSITAYAYSAKENILQVDHDQLVKDGAVSEWCATQLAIKGRELFNTDFCISTTGIAGPTGATGEKPVGTVWIGFASKDKAFAKRFQFGDHRERNIVLSANAAINLLRLAITKEN